MPNVCTECLMRVNLYICCYVKGIVYYNTGIFYNGYGYDLLDREAQGGQLVV